MENNIERWGSKQKPKTEEKPKAKTEEKKKPLTDAEETEIYQEEYDDKTFEEMNYEF